MTAAHRRAVLALDPSAGAKVRLLDPEGSEVPDPIGSSQERYDQVAAQMQRMIERRLQEQ
jgi:protein-tyrosine-phosphatase